LWERFYAIQNIREDIQANAAERPNILFIFTDDHAYQSISAYGEYDCDLQLRPGSYTRGLRRRLRIRQATHRLFVDRHSNPEVVELIRFGEELQRIIRFIGQIDVGEFSEQQVA